MQSSENQLAGTAKGVSRPAQNSEHAVSLAIWDVSNPVEEGEVVRLKAGAKCKMGCSLAGERIDVSGPEGTAITTGLLGTNPAPGTNALFWTQMEFRPPALQGLKEWTVSFERTQTPPFHSEARSRFGVMFTKPALCHLVVTVADEATRAPLANAYVRLGDATMFTDTSGKAVATVSAGTKELVSWKRDHKMSRLKLEVSKDDEITLNLTPYPCKYCPDRTG